MKLQDQTCLCLILQHQCQSVHPLPFIDVNTKSLLYLVWVSYVMPPSGSLRQSSINICIVWQFLQISLFWSSWLERLYCYPQIWYNGGSLCWTWREIWRLPLQISLNSFLHVPEKTKQTFANCINVLLTAPLETIVERNIVIKAAFSSYLLPLPLVWVISGTMLKV